jgi:hypothetical protein
LGGGDDKDEEIIPSMLMEFGPLSRRDSNVVDADPTVVESNVVTGFLAHGEHGVFASAMSGKAMNVNTPANKVSLNVNLRLN